MRRIAVRLREFTPASPLRPRDRARMLAERSVAVDNAFNSSHALGADVPKAARLPRTRGAERRHTNLKRGAEIAHEAKFMSDMEWERVPLADKHCFTQFVFKELQERPSQVTEQQRRRYFEQTQVDPTSLDPNETVTDVFERVKHGLPVHLRQTQRQFGLTDAMYESGDASLFEPDNAFKLENAMTHVRQLFADYIRKKREGLSTEAERRHLANVSAELNFQTQKHLANMFKYAGQRVQEIVRSEREEQLKRIEVARRAIQSRKGLGKAKVRKLKRERVATLLRHSYGLDAAVASSVWQHMRAHEEFLTLCEVIARLTTGAGFRHTASDETLDQYTDELRKVYSADPEGIASVDAVQYMAAVDGLAPADWAQRWFQRSLLLPLQETPEYKELLRIQEENAEAARLAASGSQQSMDESKEAAATAETTAAAAVGSVPEPREASMVAQLAETRQQRVVQLTEKMFLSPNDERLQDVHEKRLRYIAYLHMESQISRMRQNARKFEGAASSPEAAAARKLYEKLQSRKAKLLHEMPSTNPFDDPEAQSLFSEIRAIAKHYISRVTKDASALRARRIRDITAAVKEGPARVAREVEKVQQKQRRALSLRMLQLLEKDVREDMTWVENMEEAERPPLLPIPEPMSYVPAADIASWKELREQDQTDAGNPFRKQKRRVFNASFLGQPWTLPDKPILFWGTGHAAAQQALRHAAEDAERRRNGEELAPPYPCPENPWGWRLRKDILDDD